MFEFKKFYLNYRQYPCLLNTKQVLNKFQFAIQQNQPIDRLKIDPIDKETLNFESYMTQYNYDDLLEADGIIKNIKQYLQSKKYKISTKRKIEIFEFWLYWFSIFNTDGLIIFNKNYINIEQQQQPIDIDSFSFESLLSFAKEILYELESISCCFNYKREIDATKDEYFNSYLIQIKILYITLFIIKI